jgi:2-dehydropantoate 2-reductase
MTCCIVGPGLVGSFLGAAARSPLAVPGRSGRVRSDHVRLDGAVRAWRPRLVTLAEAVASGLPLLVATRAHQAPWSDLPAGAIAAQNGLGQPRPVAVCFFAVDVDDDGLLHATGPTPRVILTTPPQAWAPVLAAWRAAGILVDEVADSRPDQWEKTILNATVGPLCLATGKGMGEVWADDDLRALTLAATAEGAAIAEAEGVICPSGMVERAADFFGRVGGHQPSLTRDPGELPWVLGHLLKTADRHRLRIPAFERIADLVEAKTGLAIAHTGGVTAAIARTGTTG